MRSSLWLGHGLQRVQLWEAGWHRFCVSPDSDSLHCQNEQELDLFFSPGFHSRRCQSRALPPKLSTPRESCEFKVTELGQ